MINSHAKRKLGRMHTMKQRGIVLFFALVALLVLSLAAAALIRSVDTSTIIAGNLAFKQAATSSGDTGVDAAMGWMATTQADYNAVNVLADPAHAFNQDAPAQGYYSSAHDDPADPAYLNLFDNANWSAGKSVLVGADPDPVTGNTTRYIIQRLCRIANTRVQDADCLYSGAVQDISGQHVKLPQEVCSGPGCPVAGQTPMVRITSRVTGPKNTVSYVQAFVY
jgi:Tfp pilus assembly protein PilX